MSTITKTQGDLVPESKSHAKIFANLGLQNCMYFGIVLWVLTFSRDMHPWNSRIEEKRTVEIEICFLQITDVVVCCKQCKVSTVFQFWALQYIFIPSWF